MNPLLVAELHRMDHQDRLAEAQKWRLSRQLKKQPSLLSKLHLAWRRLSHLGHAQRKVELAQ